MDNPKFLPRGESNFLPLENEERKFLADYAWLERALIVIPTIIVLTLLVSGILYFT